MTLKLDLNKYQNIIFDCDGVVLDTNSLKEKNILKAANSVVDEKTAKSFVEYFTKGNGIPREIKIREFFSDTEKGDSILKNYNQINQETLTNAEITKGFMDFLNRVKKESKNIFLLSGGEQKELEEIFQAKELKENFQKIMGGPDTKKQNLDKITLNGNTLFFGDSEVDYQIAKEFEFDFIFMYGYTQLTDWELFCTERNIPFIKNFTELN